MIKENKEYKNVQKILLIIKNIININVFKIQDININTNSEYYNIEITYFYKNISINNKSCFAEIILDKNNYCILHFIETKLDDYKKDNIINFNKIEKQKYDDILKLFYYNKKWICMSTFNIYNNMFKNNDIYEILNKNFYYTYVIKNNKIKFISKGYRNKTYQIYNENIFNIYIKDKFYELYFKKNDINNKRKCKYNSKCIIPNCKYIHSENQDVNLIKNIY